MSISFSHRATTLAIAAVLLAGAMNVPSALSQSGPHSIIGVIFDQGTNRVLGANVYVNNTRTNESMLIITDELGRYSADIDGFPSGYKDGDVLKISASYFLQTASGTITVNPEPYQQLDLHLAYSMHVIHGYLFLPDGTPANHFPVNVTNMDKNESLYWITDISGYYRGDIGAYPSGYSVNDDISTTVFFSGFSGSNHTVVSTNPADMVNITLADIEMPCLTLYEAPASINVGENYRLLAWVVDNLRVDGIRLYLKREGETSFTKYDMIQDDGIFNDWDGDGHHNIYLYGQSTYRNLAVQNGLGDLLYYFETKDTSFTVTLPATTPQANPFRIHVVDPVMPTLTHTPITRIESGMARNFVATASDNIGIDQVNLFFKSQAASSYSKVRMLPNGFLNQYNATLPPQMYLGALEYYITCNDTSNNTVRLPAIGVNIANVVDTTPPVITHPIINSVNVGDPIYFTCTVADIWPDAVWMNFTDSDDMDQNVSMNPTGIDGYYLNVYSQNSTEIFYYTIWANDTSGNNAKVSRAFPVYDAGTPLIDHQPPAFIEYNETTAMSAYVEDDVNVSFVNLTYLPVGGTDFLTVPMANTDAVVNPKNGNFTFDIPAQASLGTLKYFINATDGAGNVISWPALGPAWSLDVLDTKPPALTDIAYPPTTPSGLPATVYVNVSENHGLFGVFLNYIDSSAPNWGMSIEMTSAGTDATGTGRYSCVIPPHEPGRFLFNIYASDISGNTAYLPDREPMLNAFNITFVDMGLPEIVMDIPDSIQVNRTATAFVNVTDETEVTVSMFYRNVLDTGFTALDVAKSNGSYVCAIPLQNHSGTLEFYAEASDGANANQTGIFQVIVWNAVPEIDHIGVVSAPVRENVAFVAQVSDDVHVESVIFSWREIGTVPYNDRDMLKDSSGIYRTDMTFSEAVVIQYHIAAWDVEGAGLWPRDGSNHEMNITDMEAPVISHQPPTGLNTSYRPIITATVTDNLDVAAVHIAFKNSTSDTFFTAAMSQVSGTDDYVAILGMQPEGNLSYYIVATDGFNEARSPATGNHTVTVLDTRTGDWAGSALLAVTAILIILAIVLMAIYYRRKSIK